MDNLYSKPTFLRKYGRQLFASFASNMGAFAFGTAWAWTATALPSMKEDLNSFTNSSVTESWITAILFLGCIVSSPISSFCIEKLGRRATMMYANLPCLFAWIMIGCSTNVEMIYVGRFVTGICTACYGSSAPLYVSETSHPKIRGRLVCSFDSMIAAGMVFINIVGSFAPWRTQAFICGLIPILGHVMLILIPETPRFLLESGKPDSAKSSIMWLQPTSSKKDIEQELAEISESCARDRSDNDRFGWKVIWEPSVLKPILIGCMLMFFHQFCGNYPIQAYGVSVFSSSGSGHPYLGIIAINTAQFIASIFPIFVVDRFGRRPLLIVSETAMTITLVSFGLYVTFQKTASIQNLEGLSWLPMTALIIYEIFYAFGIGPIPWLLMGELVSSKKTGLSLGIITCFYRVLGFGQLFFFHDLIEYLGQDGVYYFFAGCCLIGAIACYAFVPDTTGKTLDEIHNNFQTSHKSSSSTITLTRSLSEETITKSTIICDKI